MPSAPECYLVAYTPEAPADRGGVEWLTAHPGTPPADHRHD
ncbi:hypothetical protein ACIRPK_05870 [Kitasatospora sp. NPDC101801]